MNLTETFAYGYLAVALFVTVGCLGAALALASSDNPGDRADAKTYLFYGVASVAWLPLMVAAIARETRKAVA